MRFLSTENNFFLSQFFSVHAKQICQNLFKRANKSVENGLHLRIHDGGINKWIDGRMDGWAGSWQFGGRVRLKIAACFTAITRSIVCTVPLLFSLQQQNQKEIKNESSGKLRNE